MEVTITIESQVENKVYFEVEPTEKEYKNKFKFGTELIADITNDEAMISLRAQVLLTASDEFERLKDQLNIAE